MSALAASAASGRAAVVLRRGQRRGAPVQRPKLPPPCPTIRGPAARGTCNCRRAAAGLTGAGEESDRADDVARCGAGLAAAVLRQPIIKKRPGPTDGAAGLAGALVPAASATTGRRWGSASRAKARRPRLRWPCAQKFLLLLELWGGCIWRYLNCLRASVSLALGEPSGGSVASYLTWPGGTLPTRVR